MMKIMLYGNTYLPVVGGREIVMHQLAKSYQELGHEVRVVGPSAWWTDRKIKFSYPVHRWFRIPFLTNEMTWTLHLLYAYFRYKPDIIHAHTTYPTGYIVARLKKYINIPLVITPHGWDIHMIPEINVGARLDPDTDKKICYALNVAEFTTAISDSVANSISTAKVPENKIISIPNGVDLNRFQREQKIDPYDFLSIPNNLDLVVTVGNYRLSKGHEVLVEAIKLARATNKNIQLVIVGKTSPKLVKKVSDEGMNDFIKFTGLLKMPINDSDFEEDVLVAILQKAKIYVSSSVAEGAEGMSLALLEAMSAGACPIVTDISGNRDIVKNGVNGMTVPPSESGKLADAITQVLQNESLFTQLQSQSIATANQFGWLNAARQYIEAYEKAIKKM